MTALIVTVVPFLYDPTLAPEVEAVLRMLRAEAVTFTLYDLNLEDAFGFTTVEPEMSALNLANPLLFGEAQGSGQHFPQVRKCVVI